MYFHSFRLKFIHEKQDVMVESGLRKAQCWLLWTQLLTSFYISM
jgi:hypothetical protein